MDIRIHSDDEQRIQILLIGMPTGSVKYIFLGKRLEMLTHFIVRLQFVCFFISQPLFDSFLRSAVSTSEEPINFGKLERLNRNF